MTVPAPARECFWARLCEFIKMAPESVLHAKSASHAGTVRLRVETTKLKERLQSEHRRQRKLRRRRCGCLIVANNMSLSDGYGTRSEDDRQNVPAVSQRMVQIGDPNRVGDKDGRLARLLRNFLSLLLSAVARRHLRFIGGLCDRSRRVARLADAAGEALQIRGHEREHKDELHGQPLHVSPCRAYHSSTSSESRLSRIGHSVAGPCPEHLSVRCVSARFIASR